MSSYRPFSNNVSAGWVDGTTVKVDPNIMNWVDQTKTYTDNGYNNKDQPVERPVGRRSGPCGKVFGFFYSLGASTSPAGQLSGHA